MASSRYLPRLPLTERTYDRAALCLILLGSTLWIINWWYGRPLFLDEANVARNLYDRSFAGLFSPLDHKQYAAPLYLVLAKSCGEVFGYGERALRLPAMLGGFLAILGLWKAGKAMKLNGWRLLPLALLFVNPMVLRYVGEVKPYALDLGITALLIATALQKPLRPSWRWALAGTVAVWFSLPSVFVLAAIPLYSCWREGWRVRKGWLLVIGAWLLSFSGLYSLLLRPSLSSNYLLGYHQQFFVPFPVRGWADIRQVFDLSVAQLKLAYGFTAASICVGLLSLLYGLFRLRRERLFVLILPVAVVIGASVFEKYSLIPRLMLFVLPCFWLLSAGGTWHLGAAYATSRWVRPVLVCLWLVVLMGTNVVRHFVDPLTFSDARALTTELDDGYRILLHESAVSVFDYYRRIHPAYGRQAKVPAPQDLKHQERTGKYVVLYDVLTKQSNEARIARDSTWAARNGAVAIRVDSLFRAKQLYVAFD